MEKSFGKDTDVFWRDKEPEHRRLNTIAGTHFKCPFKKYR